MPKPFYKSYQTCDLCGEYAIVYDHSASYEIPANAPARKSRIKRDGRIKRKMIETDIAIV